jgi:hypothetical protein
MLDAYVIEEIKRREVERQKQDRSRPVLEIPVRSPGEPEEDRDDRQSERDDGSRPGVVVQIEL